MDFDAVVLAGGAARRLGGVDKPALSVGGTSLLDRALAACADARSTVVVGPRRPTARPVQWAREDPPGGGPLPALAAALHHVEAPLVVLLAADLPFIDTETVRALLAAVTQHAVKNGGAANNGAANGAVANNGAVYEGHGYDGALLTDGQGRDQPLAAAYRTESLRRELALIATEHGGINGLPLRLLVSELSLSRLADTAGSAFDCDTWDDVTTARARIGEHGGVSVLERWIEAVGAELGIELDVDIKGLLDLARDAAHGVDRPAAPLTTFLVGYAAARAGGGPAAVAEASRKAQALALAWAAEHGTSEPKKNEPEKNESKKNENDA
ncbi:NTP transferase domain-containing protein [Wenjunlia tyrosinilytica]|uniref:Molybdenum cofactor guanylyltransferase n=1 Tax=Wenjunlia tyrosinilytica TaxID=1544741 RepID=A0A917ZNL3_9ACTN|nr:NTP transferase domain-containing protein [Wenjunlia tyrosinilytica]GGO86021.1 molybdenum cofactor guanylyltransferase [Wenjunlia tyrosinilytica]